MPPHSSSAAAARLAEFLSARSVRRGLTQNAASHVSMAGGRFHVLGIDHGAFMDLWAAVLEAGDIPPPLVEMHRPVGPVVVDIDLRQPSPARGYSAEHVAALAVALRTKLGQLVDLAHVADARCFVLEKPAPRACGGAAGGFKDGLHLQFPGVVTEPELQLELRRAMLPHVERFLASGRGYTCSAEDAYDEAVVERAGWLMYGARKPDEPAPWTVTRTFCMQTFDAVGQEVTAPSGAGDLARLLSIRDPERDRSPMTAEGDRAVERVRARRLAAEAEAQRRREAWAAAARPALVTAELEALVGMLSPARAVGYKEWIAVGMALNNETLGSDEGLRLWQQFGSRCPTKFDADEHERHWRRLGPPRQPGEGLGAGSLRMWARADSGVQMSAESSSSDRRQTSLRSILAQNYPHLGLSEAFRIVRDDASGVANEDRHAALSGVVGAARDGCWGGVVHLVNEAGPPKFLGHILKDVRFRGPVCELHQDVPARAEDFVFNHDEEDRAVLRSVTPNFEATITILRPASKDACCILSRPGERDRTISTKRKVEQLKQRVGEVVARDPAMQQILVNNYGTINNTTSIQMISGGGTQTDEALINAMLNAKPMLRERVRFSPETKNGNCSGLYYCDPETNVWQQRHNVVVEAMLVKASKEVPGLSVADRRHIESRRGRADMVHLLASEVVDESFRDSLDAGLDTFAVANGCLEILSDSKPVFRPLRPEDRVSTTAGWTYCADAAAAMRSDLEAFLARVLPIPEERRVALAFFASLMSRAIIITLKSKTTNQYTRAKRKSNHWFSVSGHCHTILRGTLVFLVHVVSLRRSNSA